MIRAAVLTCAIGAPAFAGDVGCSIPEASEIVLFARGSVDEPWSCAIDGATVALGLPGGEVGDVRTGRVIVYVFDGETWVEHQDITLDPPVEDAFFGGGVAIEGDTLAIGAPRQGAGGLVHIYTRVDEVWSFAGTLEPDPPAVDALYGTSVALSGGVLVVGSPFDGMTGAAYVYREVEGDFEFETRLSAGVDWAWLGRDVATDGQTIVAGAPFDQGATVNSGVARVYEFDGAAWIETPPLAASDGAMGAFFGGSVDVAGDVIAVGADLDPGVASGAGAAYLFERTKAGWIEVEKLTSVDPQPFGRFGRDLAIDEDRLVVGEPEAERAWLVDLARINADVELRREEPDGGWFGSALAAGGGLAFVGAYRDATAFDFRIDIEANHDCNGNGVADRCDIAFGIPDCDRNLVPDECDVLAGAGDCDGDGELDRCEIRAEAPRIVPPDSGFIIDRHGEAMAYGGGRLVIGSLWSDQAYIATWSDGVGWVEGTPIQMRRHGAVRSVAAGEDFVLIADVAEEVDGVEDAGVVYVFRPSGDSWIEEARLTAPEPALYERFGAALAVDGDRILVGARDADAFGSNAGAALTYRNVEGEWTFEQVIAPSAPDPDDRAGHSVALSGETMAIGVPYAYDGTSRGAVDIHRWNGAMWVFETRLVLGLTGETGMGRSLALQGTTLVTGAPFIDDAENGGQVYVWSDDPGGWTSSMLDLPGPLNWSDAAGTSVALDGNGIVVGIPGFDGDDYRVGGVDVFRRVGDEWRHSVRLVDHEREAWDQLGETVVIADGRVVAAAPLARLGEILTFDPMRIDCNANGVPDECDIAGGTSLDSDGNGVPDECEGVLAGDVNGDGVVSADDLLVVLAAWGSCGDPDCPDMNGDGVVDVQELLIILSQWS